MTTVAMASAETDEALADEAPARSAAQLQAAARQARRISDEDVSEAHRHRFLRWWWDHDGHSLRLNGRLDDAEGAVAAKALHRLASQARSMP